jgi:hypothetical protein
VPSQIDSENITDVSHDERSILHVDLYGFTLVNGAVQNCTRNAVLDLFLDDVLSRCQTPPDLRDDLLDNATFLIQKGGQQVQPRDFYDFSIKGARPEFSVVIQHEHSAIS